MEINNLYKLITYTSFPVAVLVFFTICLGKQMHDLSISIKKLNNLVSTEP